MQQLTTTATFGARQLDDDALTTIVSRSTLEAALVEDDPGQLWFEVAGDDDSRLLAIDLSTADLEEMLRLSGSDDVALTLDGEEIAGLFDDEPEVEAHGMKGAIAIAVTSAALLAPAGQAAVTPSIGAAATTQRAHAAATAQRANAAVTEQVATAQAKLAKSSAAKSSAAKSSAAKLRSFKLLRAGIAR
jgi:hypothetical protein